MKKTPSLYARDHDGNKVTHVVNEVVPGSEWVIEGHGVATRKHDGTCCMVRDGKLFKRYDAKHGKVPPVGFEPAQKEPDPHTGHWPGWIAVADGPDDFWHRDAWSIAAPIPDGTYELCGPKIQKNPEGYAFHILVRHGVEVLMDAPREFNALREYLEKKNIEGIVWHHPDGRMVKIKSKDFGIKRKALGQ